MWELATDQLRDPFDWDGTLKTLGAMSAPWPGARIDDMAISEYQSLRLREHARGVTPRFPGIRVKDLLILSELGRGGQGAIYRAIDYDYSSSRGTDCHPLVVKFGIEGDTRLHGREAPIMQRLSAARIPGIASYHSHDTHESRPYLVTTLLPGSDLDRYVESNSPFQCREVADLTIQILTTLHHAHQIGILHRDLKPKNVMVERTNRGLKGWIIDWGLGNLRDGVNDEDPMNSLFINSRTGTQLGTFLWMSPEHLEQSKSILAASDVYCAALVMYYMYNGTDPFQGSIHKQALGTLSDFKPAATPGEKTVHDNLERLFRDMTARVPAHRPSIPQCLERLQQLDIPVRRTVATPIQPPKPTYLPAAAPVRGPTQSHSSLTDTGVRNAIGRLSPCPSSSKSAPDRSEPLVARDDAFLFANPYARKLNLANSLLSWDSFWRRRDESTFVAMSKGYWTLLQQLDTAEEASSLILQAAAHGQSNDLKGQCDLQQAAWRLRPWDFELKRSSLSYLRTQVKRPRFWTDPFSSMVHGRSAKLFSGEFQLAMLESEQQLRKSPWSLSAIWAEIQILDMLSMWSACAETTLMMSAALDTNHATQRTLYARLQLVAARAFSEVWDLARAAELMKNATQLCPVLLEFEEYKSLKVHVYTNLTTKRNLESRNDNC